MEFIRRNWFVLVSEGGKMYSRDELNKYEYFKQVLAMNRLSDVLDPLTGLVNRTHLINFVKSLIDAHIPFTFGMIDLDNFKYINDTYGHTTGDQMLAAVAEELRKYLSGYGVAGRFGGDEFLFVNLKDVNYPQNKSFCQQLFGNFNVLRKTYHLGEYDLFITGTAGIASYPINAENLEDLFGLIDKVLYRGKSKGRNCYIIYLPEKHKDIQIINLKKNNLYDTLKNLAAAFDASDDLYSKICAGYESLKNDLHITNMFFAGNAKKLKSVVDQRFLGYADDIDALLRAEEKFSTNDLKQIRDISPRFYEILTENEIESVLIMKVDVGDVKYGYLMFAEPHTLRIWQEDEFAIMFFFARMLGEYMQGTSQTLE